MKPNNPQTQARTRSKPSSFFEYIADKKQSFTENINGFFEKLDEVEKRLKVSQDRIDREAYEESK